MSREVRVRATDAEYAEIQDYVTSKKRWRKVAHFVRYAVYQAMDRNPAGRHDLRRGADRTEAMAGTEGAA